MSPPVRPARVLFPLGLAVCLSLYGDLTLYAVLVTQLDVVGLTLASVGIMLSVNRLVRIPGNPLGGLLVDRFGRRPLFLLGMLLGALTTASYGLLRGFWPFLAARALWGVAWIFIHVSGMSMVLDISTPATRGRLTGVYTTWQQIGFALGPLLGGLLVDAAGFRPAMLVGAGLTAVGLLVAALALPETVPARIRPARGWAGSGRPGRPAAARCLPARRPPQPGDRLNPLSHFALFRSRGSCSPPSVCCCKSALVRGCRWDGPCWGSPRWAACCWAGAPWSSAWPARWPAGSPTGRSAARGSSPAA